MSRFRSHFFMFVCVQKSQFFFEECRFFVFFFSRLPLIETLKNEQMDSSIQLTLNARNKKG